MGQTDETVIPLLNKQRIEKTNVVNSVCKMKP